MRVLPWHIAYLAVVTTANVAFVLARAGWSLPAQLAVTVLVPAVVVGALLVAGRAVRRETPRSSRHAGT